MTEQENEILNAEGLVDSGVNGAAEVASSVDYLFHASAEDFKKIPGSPIAYWVSDSIGYSFKNGLSFESSAPTRKGMVTAKNEIYVRAWFEVAINKSGLDIYQSREDAKSSGKKWFSYLKGGGYRKWYGNKFDVVNWENDGKLLQTAKHPTEDRVWATNFNLEYIFKKNINWGAVTSSEFSARISVGGELFDAGGSACFPSKITDEFVIGFLNSKACRPMLKALNPTLNFQAGNIASLPLLVDKDSRQIKSTVSDLIKTAKSDWNTYETSWDFTSNPLIKRHSENPTQTLAENYQAWWDSNQATIAEMKRLEEENNRLFIDAYGLQDELTPDVPLEEITLTVNPKYRYGGKASDDELAARFQSDTIAELISFAVGCMFGRYSLDKEGLVLAGQGETLDDYLTHIPEPTFMPDDDNVIPMIDFDGDWFEDDISERFKQFLRVSFGEANYAANLAFIEASLGKDIRKYFLKDFYKDHVQRYKKRPIYWLFSSPKGTFNAMIYLHRYRSDTVSVVLNEYLREFRTKLQARKEYFEQINISASSSQKEKTQALKTIDKINKALDEVNSYERDVLYPLAGEQIEIDLDNGVKVNYPKFGTALKKVAGLS